MGNFKMFVLSSFVILAGCQTNPLQLDNPPAFVQKLDKLGITETNVDKIVVFGNEGGMGSNLQVTVPGYLLPEIWDTIYQSRPNNYWVSSGFRRLHFYKDRDCEKPVAELFVNSTDMCYFEDNFYDSYRCPGINKILERLLKSEFKKLNR